MARNYTTLKSVPVEQYYGGNKRYVELSTSSEHFDELPTEGIADGSLTFFSDNWTVSAFNEDEGAWGDPKEIFG